MCALLMYRVPSPPRPPYFLAPSPIVLRAYHSGTWKFLLASSVSKAPAGFQDPTFSDSSWNNISVPGHWQLQDAGSTDPPIYTNTNYPFPNHPPYAPRENPTGLYRRSFFVPAAWLVSGAAGGGGREGLGGESSLEGRLLPVEVRCARRLRQRAVRCSATRNFCFALKIAVAEICPQMGQG